MNVRLHIERLVLDGLALAPSQGGRVQAAVAQELGRLFLEARLSPHLASGGALPVIRGGTIEAGHSVRPSGLGTKIAGAVFSGINDPR